MKSNSNIKITSANGVTGIIIVSGEDVYFRVYDKDFSFIDYNLAHSDLKVTINDNDAYFYEHGRDVNEAKILDHSPETLGRNG